MGQFSEAQTAWYLLGLGHIHSKTVGSAEELNYIRMLTVAVATLHGTDGSGENKESIISWV